MVDWPKIGFSDPDHPALFYDLELAGLMAHFGVFDLKLEQFFQA